MLKKKMYRCSHIYQNELLANISTGSGPQKSSIGQALKIPYKSKTLGKCYLVPLQSLMLRPKTKIKLTC